MAAESYRPSQLETRRKDVGEERARRTEDGVLLGVLVVGVRADQGAEIIICDVSLVPVKSATMAYEYAD